MSRRRPQLQPAARRLFAVALTAAVAIGASFVAPSPAGAAKKTKCDATAGWASMVGRSPAFVAGGATGLYVWQERGTWRVGATTDRGAATTITATITFDAAVSGRPVGTEGKSDIIDVRTQSVKFRFLNFGGLDGVAIDSPCASSFTIQGNVDGQALTPQQVFLGPTAASPASVPATVTRGSTVPTTTLATASAATGTAGSGAATVVAPVASQPGPATTAVVACSTAAWPAPLIGRPAFRKGPAGVYAWIEKGVLRMAFESDPGSPRIIEGRITANGPVTLRGVGGKPGDVVKANGQQVSFSLRVGGAGDTFDVVAPCATSFSLEATIDGAPAAPAQVFVGNFAAPAAALPLVLSRP